MARRACVLAVILGLGPAVFADETKAPPASAKRPVPEKPAEVPAADDELLEFLGSIDTGDEGFLDYLAQTDVPKAASKHPENEGEKK